MSGKAFDFSPESSAARWECGRKDLAGALAQLEAGDFPVGAPGLSVHSNATATCFEKVRGPLAPIQG